MPYRILKRDPTNGDIELDSSDDKEDAIIKAIEFGSNFKPFYIYVMDESNRIIWETGIKISYFPQYSEF